MIHDQPGTTFGTVASPRAWERTIGRVIDVTAAVLALLLFVPLLILIVLLVRWDSPGPALFRQQRVGAGRRVFTLYKFRTMRVGGDDSAHRALIRAELEGTDTSAGGSWKIDRDPRVTRIGGWLRRTSLDELPQLINVVRGEMALVGPRPCLRWEEEMFPPDYALRFSVRPGLTGLWQISGRSMVGTLDMLRMDVEYVKGRCLRRDVAILLATVPSMLRGDGAR